MITTIISNNKCIYNVDVPGGKYILTLVSVSGIFNPIILDTNDYIEFEDGNILRVSKRFINVDIHTLNEYLSEEFCDIIETDTISMTTKFPKPVKNYSDRFKHIYKNAPQTNGPAIIFIKCKGVPTEMRFCNQTLGETYAATISNVVSVNLNQFAITFPFSLVGGSFEVTDNQLKNIEFIIVDIYDNPIEFIGDIIWTFSLERIETSKRVITFSTENEL